MKSFTHAFRFAFLTLIIIPLLSCCRKDAPQKNNAPSIAQPAVVRLVSPKPDKVIHCGDSVNIVYEQNDTTVTIDSVAVFNGKDPALSAAGNPGNLYWKTNQCKAGQTTLRVVIYFADSLEETHNINIVLLSDIVPVNYKYRVIRKYNHDNQAYTQGLIYDKGILYESTGLEGKSSVRMVNISSGKPEILTALAPQYFGEGIALYKDELYQITYKTQVGFVYNKNTLSQIRTFDYQINEGWGLTTNGNHLIMSDGSSQLFFIEPEYFTQVDKIQVYDHKGMIDSLNELEYINGKVLANVYGQTYIVIIDPETGKVTGKLEMEGLMPPGSKNDYSKVLNGIAWNPATGHLYITGKNWPVLYEVEVTPAL
jgi:glutaminyl-peptide cyclotransferase